MRLCLIIAITIFLNGCASKYQGLYNSKPAFYSYIVGTVANENIDEEYFSKVYVTPASCQKVITSIVGLKTLGISINITQSFLLQNKVIGFMTQ